MLIDEKYKSAKIIFKLAGDFYSVKREKFIEDHTNNIDNYSRFRKDRNRDDMKKVEKAMQ
jgi:hypothetical protein